MSVDGKPRPSIGAGDYFGEIALLTGSDRTATITATSDMVCWGMTPWDFRPLVESNSTIAWKLLPRWPTSSASATPAFGGW